jgi:integrase
MIIDLPAHFDRTLPRACRNLPSGAPQPCPTGQWPVENIRLYARYQAWLLEGGAGEHATHTIYLPTAGQILGLNPIPYRQYDLKLAFEKLLDFAHAKGVGEKQQKVVKNGMEKFRRFVRQELGLGEEVRFQPFDVAAHTQELPDWLVDLLLLYQRSLQKNWRPARLQANLLGFWSKHGKMWRFLCVEQGVQRLDDLSYTYILAFVDAWLEQKYAINTINCYILYLRGFLAFLEQQGCTIPRSLARIKTLKQPDSLPKYLNDEQVSLLRKEIQTRVSQAVETSARRQALLDQAVFFLMWQGGMRVSEVEDLCQGDLDLPGRRLRVVNGKGKKDRTIYLTDAVVDV